MSKKARIKQQHLKEGDDKQLGGVLNLSKAAKPSGSKLLVLLLHRFLQQNMSVCERISGGIQMPKNMGIQWLHMSSSHSKDRLIAATNPFWRLQRKEEARQRFLGRFKFFYAHPSSGNLIRSFTLTFITSMSDSTKFGLSDSSSSSASSGIPILTAEELGKVMSLNNKVVDFLKKDFVDEKEVLLIFSYDNPFFNLEGNYAANKAAVSNSLVSI
uniref:Uncharacterized protein n=1 Tax=Ditylenchus dipsaci TaxID=166011 RepID=A0A915D906_9BILA